MNKNLTNRHNNTLDHVLISEEPLIPSSGFAASVMERISDEATHQSQPINFPWRRFVPGLLLLCPLLALLAAEMVKAMRAPSTVSVPGFSLIQTARLYPEFVQLALWVVAALAITFITWRITQKLFDLR